MTLNDTEAATSVDEGEASTTSAGKAEATSGTKPRAKSAIDSAAETVTVYPVAGPSTVYALGDIPEAQRAQLALYGLQACFMRTTDPAETFRRLKAGENPGRTVAAPKERNAWRTAYAQAKVELTKKSDAPLTLEQALAAADALTTEQLRAAKVHPVVVKHHAKLTGASAELI